MKLGKIISENCINVGEPDDQIISEELTLPIQLSERMAPAWYVKVVQYCVIV